MDAPPGPRRRQRRLDEERLVARAQAAGSAVDDQRLHVPRHVNDEVLPVVLVEPLRLDARELHAAADHAGRQHRRQRLLRRSVRGDVDESLGDDVGSDLQRYLQPRHRLRSGVGDGRHHLVSTRSQRPRGPHGRGDDRGVGKLAAARRIDEDHVGADTLRARWSVRRWRDQRRRRVQTDGVRSQIAEGDDALSRDRAVSQRLGSGGEAAGHVAGEVRRLGGLQQSPRGESIEGRRRHSRAREARGPGAEPHGGGLVGTEPIERGQRFAAGLLEQRPGPDAVAHRQGRVEHQGGGLRARRLRRLHPARPQRRARQRQRHGGDQEAAQREQHDLAEPQPSGPLPLRAEHEFDGAEAERPRTALVEQVDEDRQRDREQPPEVSRMRELEHQAASLRARSLRSTRSGAASVAICSTSTSERASSLRVLSRNRRISTR